MDTNELQLIMPNAPAARVEVFAEHITSIFEQYSMNSPWRQAAFVANVAHETAQLQYMEEIWGPTTQQKRYDLPGTLAARLGNKLAGDGRLFRGRGLLMLTGRAHYVEASDALGANLWATPDVVASDPAFAALTAGWFWDVHNLNDVADGGDFIAVVMVINGGTNGLEYRTKFYDKALEVLTP